MAKGYEPTFVTKVDPLTGPLDVALETFSRKSTQPKTKVFGRVIDPDGKPVVGAKVEPEGVQRGIGTSWGGLNGIDPLAVTDENGEFLITSTNPFDALNVVVEARGFAKLRKNGLASDKEQIVTMTLGASVSGRVVRDGQPFKKNVAIGMAGAIRYAGEFVGDFQMGTDDDGRFTFVSLPPDTEYFIYGIGSTLKDYGVIPAKKIRVGKDGSTTDAGDLALVSGVKLAGQVQLSDDAPVPAHTRVTVGFDDAWDAQFTEVDASGHFEFKNLPPKTSLSVSTRVPGYRFAGKNLSLDPWNPFGLSGMINEDKTNLRILLEPGEFLRPSHGGQVSPKDHPRNFPLFGIEAPQDLSNWIIVTGKVIDADTQEPISEFRITPGSRGIGPGPSLETHHAETHTNGAYKITLRKRASPSLFLAEAEGYLPAISPIVTEKLKTYDFSLKKGKGPEGTVVLPNGEPAAGVSAFLFGPNEQFGLFPEGRIRTFGGNDATALTDPEGRFSFPPQLDDGGVYVAAEGGFASAKVSKLRTESKITLQPWAKIKGRLIRNGKPVANENLSIKVMFNPSSGEPMLNLQHRVTTDDEGRFQFDHVPPMEVQIVTLVPLDSGGLARGWTHNPQMTLDLKPGETQTVEVEKKDAQPRSFGNFLIPKKADAKP